MKPNLKAHWDHIFQSKLPKQMMWYQGLPATSMQLINETNMGPFDPVIDVGAGASVLVDFLFDAGFRKLAVLDLSTEAIAATQKMLGGDLSDIEWHNVDVLEFDPPHPYQLWHDRALFHFFVDEASQHKYAEVVRKSLTPSGDLILATFAPSGPETCSGLPVFRHDEASILKIFGADFQLLEKREIEHLTPSRAIQPFNFFRLKRKG